MFFCVVCAASEQPGLINSAVVMEEEAGQTQ